MTSADVARRRVTSDGRRPAAHPAPDRLYELATVSKQQPSHEIKRPLYKTTICADRINTEMRLQSKHYIDIRDDTQLANVSNYYIVIIFVCISH